MKTIPQLNLACSKDQLRPVMNHVLVTKEFCVATDAHVLAYFPTESIFDDDFIKEFPMDSFLIHSEDWAKFKSAALIAWKKGATNIIEIFHSKKRNVLIEVETEEKIGKYPAWKAVVPALNDLVPSELSQIGMNAEIMATAQKIIGPGFGLKCTFYAVNRAIEVQSINAVEFPDGRAIVMPVMLKD